MLAFLLLIGKRLHCRRTKQRKFISRFVASEFVKTCDELVIGMVC